MQNPKVTADRAFNGYGTNYEGSPEPIYGPLFLPRKFKVAVTGEHAPPLLLSSTLLLVTALMCSSASCRAAADPPLCSSALIRRAVSCCLFRRQVCLASHSTSKLACARACCHRPFLRLHACRTMLLFFGR